MKLNDLNRSWKVWRLWAITGRKFLPSQLLNEPIDLLDDILTIDGIASLIKADLDENSHA